MEIRRKLWEEFEDLAQDVALPWFLVGDKNDMRNSTEKIGGAGDAEEGSMENEIKIPSGWLEPLRIRQLTYYKESKETGLLDSGRKASQPGRKSHHVSALDLLSTVSLPIPLLPKVSVGPLSVRYVWVIDLTPKDEKPTQQTIAKGFCKFHQQHGHNTDFCMRLRHEIQDLIDAKKITDPDSSKPSTQRNPLPDHRVSLISSGVSEDDVMGTFVEEILNPEKKMNMGSVYAVMVLNRPFQMPAFTKERRGESWDEDCKAFDRDPSE
ncbi:sterol methyltransferase 1 [Striga asiatica]|uniref:Sterol methyltransferase 1 n=1 Tax=Striga asiatica TaxID=4170 RepID=A0A5A7R133_STRAF|nr:sterol methyltransferase 1 [Striga asiatica]